MADTAILVPLDEVRRPRSNDAGRAPRFVCLRVEADPDIGELRVLADEFRRPNRSREPPPQAQQRGLSASGTAYCEAIGHSYPAMATVEVLALIEDHAKIEIQAIALVPA
jgi:hypothetical protein